MMSRTVLTGFMCGTYVREAREHECWVLAQPTGSRVDLLLI